MYIYIYIIVDANTTFHYLQSYPRICHFSFAQPSTVSTTKSSLIFYIRHHIITISVVIT